MEVKKIFLQFMILITVYLIKYFLAVSKLVPSISYFWLRDASIYADLVMVLTSLTPQLFQNHRLFNKY